MGKDRPSDATRDWRDPGYLPEDRSADATKSDGYAVRFESDDDGWNYRQHLVIERHGEEVARHCDGGEPEDQSFGRDWSWVEGALRQAYAFGVEDGSRRERATVGDDEAKENRHG